jgi:hypothetical protein
MSRVKKFAELLNCTSAEAKRLLQDAGKAGMSDRELYNEIVSSTDAIILNEASRVKELAELLNCTSAEAKRLLQDAGKLGMSDWELHNEIVSTARVIGQEPGSLADGYWSLLEAKIYEALEELGTYSDEISGEYSCEEKKMYIEYKGDKNEPGAFRRAIEKYDDILDALRPLKIKKHREAKDEEDGDKNAYEFYFDKLEKLKKKLAEAKKKYREVQESLEKREGKPLTPDALEKFYLEADHVRRMPHLADRMERMIKLLNLKAASEQRGTDAYDDKNTSNTIRRFKKKLEEMKENYREHLEALEKREGKQLTPDDLEKLCFDMDQVRRLQHWAGCIEQMIELLKEQIKLLKEQYYNELNTLKAQLEETERDYREKLKILEQIEGEPVFSDGMTVRERLNTLVLLCVKEADQVYHSLESMNLLEKKFNRCRSKEFSLQ